MTEINFIDVYTLQNKERQDYKTRLELARQISCYQVPSVVKPDDNARPQPRPRDYTPGSYCFQSVLFRDHLEHSAFVDFVASHCLSRLPLQLSVPADVPAMARRGCGVALTSTVHQLVSLFLDPHILNLTTLVMSSISLYTKYISIKLSPYLELKPSLCHMKIRGWLVSRHETSSKLLNPSPRRRGLTIHPNPGIEVVGKQKRSDPSFNIFASIDPLPACQGHLLEGT